MTGATGAASSPADAAYQGAPGAFSEDAARLLAGDGARLLPCDTLDAAFAAVVSGSARAAVVPIENSVVGPVPGCADQLARHAVRVTGECILPVVHALIAPPGVEASAIRRVFSHPVAIAQCEAYFRARPSVAPVPAFDTAGAVAALVRDRATDAAAIASVRAAAVYGAVVLEPEIQDSATNCTRFLRVERGAAPSSLESGYRTSLLCVLPHRPGALAAVLTVLAGRGLNLTRIESRPTRLTPFEYEFHLDLAPVSEPEVLRHALDEVRAAGVDFRILGHYPAAS